MTTSCSAPAARPNIGRLHGRRTFAQLRQDGVRHRSGPILVTARPDPEATTASVGYAIGRSVGQAVVRNRVRRRLRAIVRETDFAPGSYLIRAFPPAATLSYAELESHVRRASAQVQRP